ncbi:MULTISPECIES: flagellar motor switch protein FliG [unclassified Frondihabitans]|jgi:flagellar motor switch protein FliG|uniref:flagellar motor switch protein FliG n=1 Tax=unclassified Frondihabitans TaxID=2626248 RepID=UPI0006FE3194|nr:MULTISPECIES: flagellar motor switch protein FliG [unclassified Frondihabitans]KQQ25680.1 flagellar motor switch protein FliG [Frondihabitans sp. Leaf304]MBF4574961.1 flagellar motor switch protein FliG [Frondihabitans sp. VKM Ac-2883]
MSSAVKPVELTGAQKVAVILMQMDQARAATVMQKFNETEADEITAELVKMRRVESSVADTAVGEFHELSTQGRVTRRGGRDFAVGLLEASFGSERAAGVMERLASSMAGKSFEFLDAADSGQLLTLLDSELPQTIALVLAHLKADQASAVLVGLDVSLRTDVAQAIATMGTATPEAVGIVAQTLKVRAGAVVAPREQVEAVGGIQPLVEIINRSDAATERILLEGLEARDPALAEEVRSRMLTFVDIVKLDPRDVQQVLRGIDAAVLAIAMKGAPEAVTEVIRGNVSERNRELLDDEIRAAGPVRLSQVEEARASVVSAIRELEAQGAITVQRGDEEALVE